MIGRDKEATTLLHLLNVRSAEDPGLDTALNSNKQCTLAYAADDHSSYYTRYTMYKGV
jgi:hypothetical protein